MDEHDAQHPLLKTRVEADGFAQEVVDAGHRLDAREAAARHDQVQERRARARTALEVRLLQVRDQAVAQGRGVAERLHRQRAPVEPRKIIEVRHRTEREHQVVVLKLVPVRLLPV